MMHIDDFQVGLEVRVIDFGGDPHNRPGHWSEEGDMDEYCGCLVTIGDIELENEYIYLHADDDDYGWQWYPSDFEPYSRLPNDDPNVLYRSHKHSNYLKELKYKIKNKMPL